MLALYVHIPFCLSKCRYCAFNSQPLPPGAGGAALIRDYLDALNREMQLSVPARRAQRSEARNQKSEKGFKKELENIPTSGLRYPILKGMKKPETGIIKEILTSDFRHPTCEIGGESLRSIYFGGGTPTILDPSCLCSLLEQSKRCFHWDEPIEITVEANPATVTRAGLAELRQAGVNRLSLGVQSFAASDLQLLGRAHGVSDIYAACRDARAAGFHNLNLDLIYALPGQTAAGWRENLERALDLDPRHLSVYGLKLEPGTPLAEDVSAGRLQECGEEEQLAMWHETQRLTSAAGFERYEISNYARPGRESRHNLAYWLNQPYLALGMGASGYLRSETRGQKQEKDLNAVIDSTQIFYPASGFRSIRYTNHEEVNNYIAAVARGELPRAWEEHQSSEQERADTVMMGLRLTAGLDRAAFEARFGHTFEFFYGEQLANMKRDGLMGESEEAVFLTERGLLLSNYALAEFI